MKTLIILLLTFSNATFAKIKMELIKDKLDVIWGMDFIGDKLIVTEKKGKIKLIDLKTKAVTLIDGAPEVFAKGQGGLLDIKKHPDFSKNKRIYLTYSKSLKKKNTTALGFGTLEGEKLRNFKEIFAAKGDADSKKHFGSRIAFDENNKIFICVGERGTRDNAQDLTNNFGKIMRLNDDGSIPKDNPFVGNKEALDSIWSYGHRNPQGLVYDLPTKTLYEMEHGPRGGDEINIIKKGQNYGWPKASYGKEYWNPFSVGDEKVKGTKQPLKYFTPSIAPSGLIHYKSDKFAELKGALISGALALTHLNIYFPETEKEIRLFEEKKMRVRAVSTNKAGDIYFSTDAGQIFKLTK